MDTRLIREFAKVVGKGILFIAAFTVVVIASMYIGAKVLGDPNLGFLGLAMGFLLWMAWGVAKDNLKWRDREQAQTLEILGREEIR